MHLYFPPSPVLSQCPCPPDICCNPIVKPVIFWNVWKIAGGHDTKRLNTIIWDRFQRRCVLNTLKGKKKEGKGEKDSKQSRLFHFLPRSSIPWTRKDASSWTTLAPAPQCCWESAGAKAVPRRCLCSFGEPAGAAEPDTASTTHWAKRLINVWLLLVLQAENLSCPLTCLTLRAQNLTLGVALVQFYRAACPLTLWNHAIFCTCSPIQEHTSTLRTRLSSQLTKSNITAITLWVCLAILATASLIFLQRGSNDFD